jgi:hypothetical protein
VTEQPRRVLLGLGGLRRATTTETAPTRLWRPAFPGRRSIPLDSIPLSLGRKRGQDKPVNKHF